MQSLSKIIFCTLFVSLLQGCAVGLLTAHPQMLPPVSNPTISSKEPENHGYTMDEAKISSCSQLESTWGKPDETEANGSYSILKYKYGFVWTGVNLFIGPIIPIPLIIPVGRKSVDVTCKDNKIISTTDRDTHVTLYGCYYVLLDARCR